MKIGIIGTRGIPNEYGGFEQFAEDFGVRMAARGHEVTVYTSHRHSYKNDVYKGVKLVHCFDPEHLMGTAGQFIYDLNCIRDSRKRNFDVIMQLGYTSSTIWSWLFPAQSLLVTNMDGLEWKRSKYNKLVQRFLRVAEKWGVKYSDHLIADSPGIQKYLASKYNADSTLVAYGADLITECDGADFLEKFGIAAGNYDLLIARFESENNLSTILEAYEELEDRPLVLVGRHDATPYGRSLYARFGSKKHIHFVGGIFDRDCLNALRHQSRIYYHGHSVGGTNPSLIEAMACGALICANDNDFNRAVLNDNAWFFRNAQDIRSIVNKFSDRSNYQDWLDGNRARIASDYSWDGIADKLECCFQQWLDHARVPEHVGLFIPERS